MAFDTTDEERAFWDDEPRRPRRRQQRAPEHADDRPAPRRGDSATGQHPALSSRAAAIAAARTGRAGTRRHGDPTGAIPAVRTPASGPTTRALPDIWDDDAPSLPHDTIGPGGRHLSDIWDADVRTHELRDTAFTIHPSGHPSRSRRDVARLRLGMLAAASVVLVPVAFALDGNDDGLRTSTPAAAVALPAADVASTAAPATIAPAAGDPTSAAAAADPGTDPAGDPSTIDAGNGSTTADPLDPASSAPAAAQVESLDAATTSVAAETVATEAASEAPVSVAATAPDTEAPSTDAPTTEPPTTEAPTTTLDRAAAHAAAVAACGNTYEIAPGDYWIGIADAIDVPLADLLDLNAATVDTPLYAGREVCLPAGAHIVPTTTAATTTTAAPTTTTKPTTTTAPKSTTTTAAPASTTPKTTTTTEAPPKNTYSRAEVEAIIREVWPDDLEDEAVRIATRESNLIPTVRNYCCYGLFQIYYSVHRTWLAQMGVTSASQLYDPRVSATAAYALYQRSGSWAPWAL